MRHGQRTILTKPYLQPPERCRLPVGMLGGDESQPFGRVHGEPGSILKTGWGLGSKLWLVCKVGGGFVGAEAPKPLAANRARCKQPPLRFGSLGITRRRGRR